MGLIDDQQLVQAFFLCGSNASFHKGVGVRRENRRRDHVYAFGTEGCIESCRNLLVIVASPIGFDRASCLGFPLRRQHHQRLFLTPRQAQCPLLPGFVNRQLPAQ